MSIITTLDGKQWEKQELLDNMFSDEFYYGYLGKHALSSSSCKSILKSPKGYYFQKKYGKTDETPALIAGRIFHTLVLEPEKVDSLTFVDSATRNTNKFKAALQGKEPQTVYTIREKNAAERLADQLFRNDAAAELLNDCLFEQPEAMMIDGIAFRGKADILHFDKIVDVKTSSDINSFKYSADKYGYDLQAALYCKMFNRDKFQFLVIDKKSFDIGIYDCSPEFMARGQRKLDAAIKLYDYFFKTQGVDLDQYVKHETL